jgi:hypothetical protein
MRKLGEVEIAWRTTTEKKVKCDLPEEARKLKESERAKE